MSRFTTSGRRIALLGVSAAVLVAGGLGIAAASTTSTPSNAVSQGRGVDEFGMTKTFFAGKTLNFTYTKGFYCDTSIPSAASSGCEAGANYKTPPAKNFDPLYITVPLGFSAPSVDGDSKMSSMLECPTGLICVDHPGTIDLARLEPTLKPLYPSLTDKQLTAALSNATVPGHDHFITTANGGQPEWWDVKVVGVTSPQVYEEIQEHKSFSYVNSLIKAKNKNVVGPVDTNLFLYFAVN
jgi:hypothetical protein